MTISDNYITPISRVRSSARKAILGTIFGQAVGDALGAPFEFRGANEYANRFPYPVYGGNTEMIGGGAFGWKPGEFTDDTQMALIAVAAINEFADDIDNGEFDDFLDYLYRNFQLWAHTAADVGGTTRGSLNGPSWREGAKVQHDRSGFSASNGSVMRTGPIVAAACGYDFSQMRIFDLALQQGRLTHWDPVAAQCTVILAAIIEESIFAASECREDYRYCDFSSIIDNASIHAAQAVEALMSKDEVASFFNTLRFVTTWRPEIGGPSNGKAISCLGQALWAVRTSESFEEAVVKAINLGGDTDTVAAVAGSIAGARWGIDGIPARWTTAVNGSAPIMSNSASDWTSFDYQSLIDFSLATLGEESTLTPFESEKSPKRVDDNYEVYAANLNGIANSADDSFAVVSLCRTNRLTDKFSSRRNFYIIDTPGANDHLGLTVNEAIRTIDAWLSEGKKVVVHCHAGRSRTGFILRAWYMNKYNATAAESLEWLSSRWPAFDPYGNIDFSEFLGCNAFPDDIFEF